MCCCCSFTFGPSAWKIFAWFRAKCHPALSILHMTMHTAKEAILSLFWIPPIVHVCSFSPFFPQCLPLSLLLLSLFLFLAISLSLSLTINLSFFVSTYYLFSKMPSVSLPGVFANSIALWSYYSCNSPFLHNLTLKFDYINSYTQLLYVKHRFTAF